MSRSRIRLAAVVAAGLLLAACAGADDTAGEASPTSTAGAASPTSTAGAVSPTSTAGAVSPTSTAGAVSPTAAPTEAGEMQSDATGDDMDMDDGMDMSGAYGEPADASEADRTIEVAVDNEFVFEPAEFEVAAGEVVTFQITNTGDVEHEFVLGDEQAQQQMAEEMAEGDGHAHSGEMSNAVTVHPGEEAELTWRFPDEATTVLVGCHVPGHWEAGMRGSVTVA